MLHAHITSLNNIPYRESVTPPYRDPSFAIILYDYVNEWVIPVLIMQVCELDIIFNFEKAYFMLDELLIGGEVQETSKKNVLKAIAAQDLLQEVRSRSQGRRVVKLINKIRGQGHMIQGYRVLVNGSKVM